MHHSPVSIHPYIVTLISVSTNTIYTHQGWPIYIGIGNHIHVHVDGGGEQGYENIEPTTGHFDLFSPLLSCSPYTLYRV